MKPLIKSRDYCYLLIFFFHVSKEALDKRCSAGSEGVCLLVLDLLAPCHMPWRRHPSALSRKPRPSTSRQGLSISPDDIRGGGQERKGGWIPWELEVQRMTANTD